MKQDIIENGCNNTVEVYKKVITFDVTKEQMEYLKSIEDTDEYWEIFYEIKEVTNDYDNEWMELIDVEFEECIDSDMFQCIATYSAD